VNFVMFLDGLSGGLKSETEKGRKSRSMRRPAEGQAALLRRLKMLTSQAAADAQNWSEQKVVA